MTKHDFMSACFRQNGVIIAKGFYCKNCKATILYWYKNDGPIAKYIRSLIIEFIKKIGGDLSNAIGLLWLLVTHKHCFINTRAELVFLEGCTHKDVIEDFTEAGK